MPFVYIYFIESVLLSFKYVWRIRIEILSSKNAWQFLPQNAIVLLNFNYGSISMEPNLNNKIDTPGCVLMEGGILWQLLTN